MENSVQGFWRAVRFRILDASRSSSRQLNADQAGREKAYRATPNYGSRRRYLPALGLLLCAASHGTPLPHWEFAVPNLSENGTEWFCQTEVRNNEWYMRCSDLRTILGDDPVLPNNVVSPELKLIPLFGAPFADSPLSTLAESVLCGGDQFCNVVVAAW